MLASNTALGRAYILAVLTACLLVGAMMGLYEVLAWKAPIGTAVFYFIMAPFVGILPGLIISFPGLFLSVHLRDRFGLVHRAWYWLFGMVTGLLASIPVVLVSIAASGPGSAYELLVAAFALAGGGAGLVFAKVEASNTTKLQLKERPTL